MNPLFRRLGRAFVVLTGLAAGVAVLVVFVVNRESPERLASTAAPVAVRMIEARSLPFRFQARGYGVARPAQTWQAIASVSGRVVERHDGLESGVLLPAGTLLLALDPSRYRLVVAEVEAELAGLSSDLSLLETEEANTRRLLDLEREHLSLAEQELQRIEQLAARGTVSTSRRDEQRRGTLARRQAVAVLENTLALMPARRAVLAARSERVEMRLSQARRDLEDTRFVAPYDLRFGDVEVEMHQFVTAGQRLFQADGLAAAEVEAHVPVNRMRRLLGGAARTQPGREALDLGERIDFSAVDAELELVGAEGIAWKGELVRVASGLDPVTRTVRSIIRVDHPYRDARPPDRPPLLRDMYLRVTLSAPSPDPLLVVPASALHQGELYLVDGEDRLERRTVQVAFEQGDLAVIAAGLAAGDRVLVDDPPAPIRGTALAPRRDRALERRIGMMAAGGKP